MVQVDKTVAFCGKAGGRLCRGLLPFLKAPFQPPAFHQSSKAEPNYLLQTCGTVNTLVPFSFFYCGSNCNKTKKSVGSKRKRKELSCPQSHTTKQLPKVHKEPGTQKKGLRRGALVAALKNQGIVVTHSSKRRGYHGCKRLILVCIVYPPYMRKSLMFVLNSRYWS